MAATAVAAQQAMWRDDNNNNNAATTPFTMTSDFVQDFLTGLTVKQLSCLGFAMGYTNNWLTGQLPKDMELLKRCGGSASTYCALGGAMVSAGGLDTSIADNGRAVARGLLDRQRAHLLLQVLAPLIQAKELTAQPQAHSGRTRSGWGLLTMPEFYGGKTRPDDLVVLYFIDEVVGRCPYDPQHGLYQRLTQALRAVARFHPANAFYPAFYSSS